MLEMPGSIREEEEEALCEPVTTHTRPEIFKSHNAYDIVVRFDTSPSDTKHKGAQSGPCLEPRLVTEVRVIMESVCQIMS